MFRLQEDQMFRLRRATDRFYCAATAQSWGEAPVMECRYAVICPTAKYCEGPHLRDYHQDRGTAKFERSAAVHHTTSTQRHTLAQFLGKIVGQLAAQKLETRQVPQSPGPYSLLATPHPCRHRCIQPRLNSGSARRFEAFMLKAAGQDP